MSKAFNKSPFFWFFAALLFALFLAISTTSYAASNKKPKSLVTNYPDKSVKKTLSKNKNQPSKKITKSVPTKTSSSSTAKSNVAEKNLSTKKIAVKNINFNKPVIVIDPGHGGQDPGAIGKAGTYEKNITLAYANALKNLLSKSGKYTVFLTRNRDVYVGLNERIQRARKVKGDIFISIHADSTRNSQTTGFSVYTLSDTRAKRVANKLIREANSGKDVVGVKMNDKPKDVKVALIDMAQTDALNTSESFSAIVARKLGQKVKPLERTRREASLQVLTAADMPSVLIELGYLSNTLEERLLKQEEHKIKVITGIKAAIDEYFFK